MKKAKLKEKLKAVKKEYNELLKAVGENDVVALTLYQSIYKVQKDTEDMLWMGETNKTS